MVLVYSLKCRMDKRSVMVYIKSMQTKTMNPSYKN
jgi:hypothetical protein